MKDVIIIGAGIAGLTAGLELEEAGIDFQILESSNRAGGMLESVRKDNYLVETGPHLFSSVSAEIMELVKKLDLKEELIEANKDSKKRYICLNSNLISLPRNPVDLYKSGLLSKDAKWTLLEEFVIPKEIKEETIEQFFLRRFGREVLKNIIQPFLIGVYAGDVVKLSANAVFPELKELEKKYGSILGGFILSGKFKKLSSKCTFYSFKDGMETLGKRAGEKLKNNITFNTSDLQVTRAKDFFIVSYKVNNKQMNYTANSVLFAVPAYKIMDYSHLFPNKHFMELFETEYMPMVVVSQSIDKSKIGVNLDGFGFLCAHEPRRKLLGTLWESSIFLDRAPAEKALLTSFVGGAYHKKVLDQSEDEIISLISKELAEILQISDKNAFETVHVKTYPKAIPQYYVGHLEKVKRVEEMMDKNYGLFFTGNYIRGISVNDTIKTTKSVVKKIKRFLSTVRNDGTANDLEENPDKELIKN